MWRGVNRVASAYVLRQYVIFLFHLVAIKNCIQPHSLKCHWYSIDCINCNNGKLCTKMNFEYFSKSVFQMVSVKRFNLQNLCGFRTHFISISLTFWFHTCAYHMHTYIFHSYIQSFWDSRVYRIHCCSLFFLSVQFFFVQQMINIINFPFDVIFLVYFHICTVADKHANERVNEWSHYTVRCVPILQSHTYTRIHVHSINSYAVAYFVRKTIMI